MAWNEPGGGNKNPWGGRNGDKGPPDLDEIIRKMQTKFGGLFGSGGGRTPKNRSPWGIGLLAAIAALIWIIYDSAYIIEPAQRGVVLRFGNHVDTLQPGFSLRFPRPIERVLKVDVDQIRSINHQALMLTQDENIVQIKLAVQYNVKDATAYLFNTRDPDATLKHATSSSVREVVGKSTMDYVLTEGRDSVAVNTQKLLQAIIDRYKTGLQVAKVNLQDAQPPEEVQSAFADAIKAREDEQRLKNEAEAYANEIIPKARGAAAREIEEAKAYRARVVAEAEGDASRFVQLLSEYQEAPVVMRERLYLEAMESVLNRSSKIMVDVKGGNNLVYLPLDKLLRQDESAAPSSGPLLNLDNPPPLSQENDIKMREDARTRERR